MSIYNLPQDDLQRLVLFSRQVDANEEIPSEINPLQNIGAVMDINPATAMRTASSQNQMDEMAGMGAPITREPLFGHTRVMYLEETIEGDPFIGDPGQVGNQEFDHRYASHELKLGQVNLLPMPIRGEYLETISTPVANIDRIRKLAKHRQEFESSAMILVGSGMRGVNPRLSFSEKSETTLTRLNENNVAEETGSPYRVATWQARIDPTGVIDEGGADSSDTGHRLNYDFLRKIGTLLRGRLCDPAYEGIVFEKGRIRPKAGEYGEKMSKGGMTYPMLVSPESMEHLRSEIGDNATVMKWKDAYISGGNSDMFYTDGIIGSPVEGITLIETTKTVRFQASGGAYIDRGLLLGRNAMRLGYGYHRVPMRLKGRFHERENKDMNGWLRWQTWIAERNDGRQSVMISQANFAVSNVVYQLGDEQVSRARGILRCDMTHDWRPGTR